MEKLEEDLLRCCRAVSDKEWLLSLLVLPLKSAVYVFLI